MEGIDEYMFKNEFEDDPDEFSIETGKFDLLADFPLFILE